MIFFIRFRRFQGKYIKKLRKKKNYGLGLRKLAEPGTSNTGNTRLPIISDKNGGYRGQRHSNIIKL